MGAAGGAGERVVSRSRDAAAVDAAEAELAASTTSRMAQSDAPHAPAPWLRSRDNADDGAAGSCTRAADVALRQLSRLFSCSTTTTPARPTPTAHHETASSAPPPPSWGGGRSSSWPRQPAWCSSWTTRPWRGGFHSLQAAAFSASVRAAAAAASSCAWCGCGGGGGGGGRRCRWQ